MINVSRVVELLSASCAYLPDEISLESDLVSDLEYDSFSMMDLLLTFEKEFDISIPDRDLRQFVTVADVVDYLEKKTAPDGTLSVDNSPVL